MKILHINAVNKIRSTGRMIEEMNTYLSDYNVESVVAYSVGPHDDKSYRINNIIDAKVHAMLSRITGKQGYFSKKSTGKLIEYIRRFQPDIIHLHNLHSNYINVPELLNFISKDNIPLVLTLHDCWFFTGKCTHYFDEKCYKWQTICNKCPQLKKDNKSIFFDKTEKMFLDKKKLFSNINNLYVIGVSKWITDEAKKSPILQKANVIKTVHNWVDTNKFCYRELKVSEKIKFDGYDKIILGVASNWSKSKGIDRFISLSKRLKKNECIVLIGNINQDQDLPKNVINIKETHDENELIKYYLSADVFVNFSSQESFGKVTVEALACGLPAIVGDSTANPEIINSSCGYILNNYEEEKVIKLLDNIFINGREYYKDNCIKFVQKNFNLEKQINKYFKFYEGILKKEI